MVAICLESVTFTTIFQIFAMSYHTLDSDSTTLDMHVLETTYLSEILCTQEIEVEFPIPRPSMTTIWPGRSYYSIHINEDLHGLRGLLVESIILSHFGEIVFTIHKTQFVVLVRYDMFTYLFSL